MIILPCPACKQPLVLEDSLSEADQLECPLCSEHLSYGELLDSLPKWNVMAGASSLDHTAEPEYELDQESEDEDLESEDLVAMNGSETASEEQYVKEEYESQTEEATDEAQLLQENTTDPTEREADESSAEDERPAGWSDFQPVSREQHQRSRRKKRSPIWSILQVVLGGFASIPVALLLLWYVFGKDIADAGPTVAKFAPWIVPKQFHPLSSGSRIDSLSQLATPGPSRKPPAEGSSGFKNFDDVLSATPEEKPTSEDSALAPPVEEDSAQTPESQEEPVDTNESSETDEGPSVTVQEDIFSTIRTCKSQLQRWQEAVAGETPKTELKAMAPEVFQAIVDLTAALAAEPQPNPRERMLRQELSKLNEILSDKQVQVLVAQGSLFWLQQQSDEPEVAVALIAKVVEVEENEAGWKLTTDHPTASAIIVPKNVADSAFSTDAELLLMVSAQQESVDSAPEERPFVAHHVVEL